MRRLLLLFPLLVVPPVLVAAYFVYFERTPPLPTSVSDHVPGNIERNSHAAQMAFQRANQLLSQARQTHSTKQPELLTQAVIQYRVCLAYEPGAPSAGQLFADARQNLEASRLLLEQSAFAAPTRPTTQVARAAPPPPAPLPERKPEAVPVDTTPMNPPVAKPDLPLQPATEPATKEKAEPAQAPGSIAQARDAVPPALKNEEPPKKVEPRQPRTVKTIAVGPDGVIYEKIETVAPDSEEKPANEEKP